MDKILVKIFVNDKDLCSKKLSLKENLLEVRKKIKFESKNNIHFINDESPIRLEDENELTVEY